MVLLLLFSVLALAFANGANDNFKGVATLLGSGRASYRRALIWGTLTTFLGSLTAIFLAEKLARSFSGRGIVPDFLVGDPLFVFAVAIGACSTVLLATRIGFPISTTHALLGGLIGGGLAAQGGSISVNALLGTILLPLLLSPLVALLLTFVVYRFFRFCRQKLGVKRESCICLGQTEAAMAVETLPAQERSMSNTSAASIITAPKSTGLVAHLEGCKAGYQGQVVGVDAQRALDALHFASAGTMSFARGLNDAPKILGLIVAGQIIGQEIGIVFIALAMATGGLLAAKRVARTMSHEITEMNEGQAFTGNFVTAGLVLAASLFALPVSTTHVSVGSLFGIGAASGSAKKKAIGQILLAWVVTLPMAAALTASVILIAG